jgi:uncharacterized repeat protein (TIGR01451 family)
VLAGTTAALAQVTAVDTDTTTHGSWISKYGACGFVLFGQKDAVGVQTPVCNPATGVACPNQQTSNPLQNNPLLGNYNQGATSDLQDCRGQTSTSGFIGNIHYTTRLCGVANPGFATIGSLPPGYITYQGQHFPPNAQGYLWQCNSGNAGALQFPSNNLQVPPTSCDTLGSGCSFPANIASTADDAAETLCDATPVGLCIDLDFSGVPAVSGGYKLSAYFLDFDNGGASVCGGGPPRVEDVDLFFADGTHVAGSSKTVSSFQQGTYINWTLNPLPSKLTINVDRSNSVNAVLSALFLDQANSNTCGLGPHITLKKLTNGIDTPNPNDGQAPAIPPGSGVTWSYLVTNDGPENLVNISLTDTPVGPISCPSTALSVGQSMICTKTGVAQTLTLGGPNTVSGTCGGQQNKPLYENTGHVVGTGQISNIPVSAEYKSHYCNTNVPPPPQLSVVKSPKNGTFTQGSQVSFTIVVSNPAPAGSSSATNVQLTDALPGAGGLIWQTATPSQGTCANPIASNNLSCSLGTIAAGGSVTVTVTSTATTPPGACQLQSNPDAHATADGGLVADDSGSLNCTPPPPTITIKKFTNGADANDPNGTDVPNVNPGTMVTWTYVITNTGTVSIPKGNITVTDNTPGVTPVFDSILVGSDPNNLAPGNQWLYKTTGIALDLTQPPPAGVHTQPMACTANGTQPPRTAYTNIGTVTIPGQQAMDPSSYCNPPPLECPAGGFSFFIDANGDLNITYDQFPAPNDNSYGVNAVGWGGANKHKFQDLVGSDHAGFQLTNASGTVVLSFNIDYISQVTTGTLPPSGYKSLGPFGGDGKILTGTLAAGDIEFDSSLARNLNNTGYFSGGVQVVGKPGTAGCPGANFNCQDLLINSPTTVDTISNYTLVTPNPWNAGWDFHDTYFVKLHKAKLQNIGFLNAAGQQVGTVSPNLDQLHNSPAKACPAVPPGPVNVTVTKAAAASGKNVVLTLMNNTTTSDAILTALALTWPASNGNLQQVKFDGDVVYNVSSAPPSLTLNTAQLQAASTDAKRTIAKNSSDTVTLVFQNNADTNMTHYTGTFTFNSSSTVNLFP